MNAEAISQFVEIIRQWYWIPLLIVYLAIILTILIENRNPAKTIAWVLVIVFLPVIGVVIYYLFGQKFSKIKTFQESNQLQHIQVDRAYESHFSVHGDCFRMDESPFI